MFQSQRVHECPLVVGILYETSTAAQTASACAAAHDDNRMKLLSSFLGGTQLASDVVSFIGP
jgi:hypothetical protein